MSRRSAKAATFLLLNPFLAGLMTSCSGQRPATPTVQETIDNVTILTAQNTKIPDVLDAVGTVRATQLAQISSQIMGTILEINVREGDRVEQGQVLAVIDEAQPRAAVEQALAAEMAAQKEVAAADSDYVLADATMKRYQQLYEKKSASPQEFDEVKARYLSAAAHREMAQAARAQSAAALAQAKKSLEYTRVGAPFSGSVTERKADPGTLASVGLPLFTIEDTRNYRLEISVDESDIRLVHSGQTVSVIIDSLDTNEMRGTVSQIVPAADAASRSFIVKIQLPADSRMRSGIFGRAHILRGERSAVLIPQTAVVARGQMQSVYVVDQNQTASLRYVTLGRIYGQQVEVLSGLQGGEKLVATPGARELAGKRVLVKP
jgi:RND family efflux transporter MFP subunit